MNLLSALFDAIVNLIQRNPITCLVLFILAVAAPAVLKGIAIFILYFVLGIIMLGVVLVLLFRWKIYRMRQQMGDQFGGQAQGGFGGNPFASDHKQSQHEGDVKIYRTSETPEKRVSKEVGDYVEFEETKEDNK